MSEEWSDWIPHGGQPQPVPSGTFVRVEFRAAPICGQYNPWADGAYAEQLAWYHDGGRDDIIRYRIRKPKGLTILERIASQPQERVEA